MISFLVPIAKATMSVETKLLAVSMTATVYFTKTCVSMTMFGGLEVCETGNPGGKGAGAMYATFLAEALLSITVLMNCCKFRGKACAIATNVISALALLIATILVLMHNADMESSVLEPTGDDDAYTTTTPFKVENGPAMFMLILAMRPWLHGAGCAGQRGSWPCGRET